MDNIHYKFVNSITEITEQQWQKCRSDNNPTTDYKFLLALENSKSTDNNSGWHTHHAIVYNHKQPIACMPLYLKTHPYGEYIFDHILYQTYQQLGKSYYPKLLCAIPFTPVVGERIITQQKINYQSLINNLKQLAQEKKCSSFHCNFASHDNINNLKNNGMLIRKTHQYHWHNKGYKNFNQFLENLSSRKRKNIKKERSYIQKLGIYHKLFTKENLTHDIIKIFYQFYCLTYDKKWGQPYLTLEFFLEIAKTMSEQTLIIIGYLNQKPISGAINFIDNNRLIGRHWGCSQHINFLHFETCYYQAIDFACANNIEWVEAGTQGEHKIQRGYQPIITYSAHYLMENDIAQAYQEYLTHDNQNIDTLIQHINQLTPYKNHD